ncbi:MAG: response regulator [Candidatus Sericytochromatia bacterium]|nr:response regulator [Candidatus Sericytochromatia bacterium]
MTHAILVVDDSATVRQQLTSFLKNNGFEATAAENGTDALQQAQSRSKAFDMVVTDVNMPQMGGLEMIAALRLRPGYAKTPIFVLTTESTADIMAKGKALGATAWIVKPFKPEILLKGIHKVLGL